MGKKSRPEGLDENSVDVKEAEKITGLTISQLQYRTIKGQISAIKIKGVNFYNRIELENFKDSLSREDRLDRFELSNEKKRIDIQKVRQGMGEYDQERLDQYRELMHDGLAHFMTNLREDIVKTCQLTTNQKKLIKESVDRCLTASQDWLNSLSQS